MQIKMISLIYSHVVDAIILEVQDTVGKPSRLQAFGGRLVEPFQCLQLESHRPYRCAFETVRITPSPKLQDYRTSIGGNAPCGVRIPSIGFGNKRFRTNTA